TGGGAIYWLFLEQTSRHFIGVAPGSSAFAQQFVDAALKLTLLDLALSQPFVEVIDRSVRCHDPEGEADLVGLPPDQLGEEGAALACNGQVHFLWQFDGLVELDAGA